MDKRFAVIIAFVVLVSVVAIAYSSYYSTLLEMQQYRPNISQQAGPVNLSNGSPILGESSAPITIVEFGDYQCEGCYHWFHNTRAEIIDNYVETGKAKLVFLDLPFLGRDSPKAAHASYCAEDQGKYWEYHATLYNFQEGIDDGWASQDRLSSFAYNLGLDVEQFDDCMGSEKYAKRIMANYDQAVNQGVQATPSFVLISPDGLFKKIQGAQPYSVFAKIIEQMP